ncbi:WD repeat-containing protein 91 [Apophysomyces ossiformis]|uniref:WD repeat-containing protein 91 n=1 Tax=Apophysomyces ossiformis TaxID=679940 RepID=A0A8H7BZ54_9FUNG|nr:WD repeat-containing protein 91 [Apophysomyces ossiformis]
MDRIQRKAQQAEIETLKNSVENLKATIDTRENEIAKLKHELAETRREMTDGITLIRRRAASMTTDARLSGSKGKAQDKSGNEKNTKEESNNKLQTLGDEEPFVVVSQEEFSEHASAITHAKFSCEGNLIASCDMDNIVRIWSYKGHSFNPLKINNNTSNIHSMEWDARSERFLFLGTDAGLIRIYNVESKAIVQEFAMDEKYPWVTQLSCSPVEPIVVCAGLGSKTSSDSTRQGALVAWSMKSMSACGSFELNPDKSCTDINTIKLNHNGQMLVVGDQAGLMRIFDIRSMKSIMEWKTASGLPSCIAQFSFDENSIYTIDHGGQLSQWSIHKPGTSLSNAQLSGFPPPPAFPPPQAQPSPVPSSPTPLASTSTTSIHNNTLPPRPKSNPSTSSLSRLSISSGRSTRLPTITVDDSVTQSLLSVSPRSEMIAFSADTEHILCASTASSASLSKSSSISSLISVADGSNGTATQGTIYNVSDGQAALRFGHQPAYQKLTTVDWTNSSNACLLGSMDGSVKVTNLIKV